MAVGSIGHSGLATPAAPCGRQSDRDLVLRVAQGEAAAHRTLYERFAPELLSYLWGRLGDRQAAEDVLQEVMWDVWRQAGRFRGDSKVRTWLLSIAHHQASNYLRRPVNRTPAVELGDGLGATSSSETVPSAAVLDLNQAFERLSREHRAVLDLVFFHGFAVDEAAEVLGVAGGTVKSRLFRARAHLRALLEPESASDV